MQIQEQGVFFTAEIRYIAKTKQSTNQKQLNSKTWTRKGAGCFDKTLTCTSSRELIQPVRRAEDEVGLEIE